MYHISKMATIFCVFVSIMLLGACEKTEYSNALSEIAEITEVVYTPQRHGTANGLSFSSSGDVGISKNSILITEAYAVVFKCEHGKFIITRKDVWEKAKVGMKVIVHYREQYRVTGDTRELVKYDFIDFDVPQLFIVNGR